MSMECSAVLVCGSSSRKGLFLADYDLIIIGGGPAGLTAGLYAARANMSAVLLEGKDTGGEILNTDLIEDYPGFESVTGHELAQAIWGDVAVTQAFLTLSEVIGHVDLLVNAGYVREVADGDVVRYEATSETPSDRLGDLIPGGNPVAAEG